jgi:hypothetical protein
MIVRRRVVRGLHRFLDETSHVAVELALYCADDDAERDALTRARLAERSVHVDGAAWLVAAVYGEDCFQLSRRLPLPGSHPT